MIELISFPPVTDASEDGLLAMGGELTVDTLVSAYSQGIFPWFSEDQPILWWSPDPRMVLFPNDIKISRSLKKTLRRGAFRVSCNAAFDRVIKACALRGQQNRAIPNADTWITDSMNLAYRNMHQQGYAHSLEVWQDTALVGGLYGVVLGNVFFGESMFSRTNDASKVALVALSRWLHHKEFSLIDCQVASDHLGSLGAIEITRERFLTYIKPIDATQENLSFAKGFERFMRDNAINKQ